MNTLYLIRHSLTQANEQHLYCGCTDLPLTEKGRAHASATALQRPIPPCAAYAASGMKRTEETLYLLAGTRDFEVIPDLMEMNFGEFEMFSYEQLCACSEYIRWIEDATGDLPCPGGESRNSFSRRVIACADALIGRDIPDMLIVCHGGVIANIMPHWFPGEDRNFYQWQPGACGGYAVHIENGRPTGYDEL